MDCVVDGFSVHRHSRWQNVSRHEPSDISGDRSADNIGKNKEQKEKHQRRREEWIFPNCLSIQQNKDQQHDEVGCSHDCRLCQRERIKGRPERCYLGSGASENGWGTTSMLAHSSRRPKFGPSGLSPSSEERPPAGRERTGRLVCGTRRSRTGAAASGGRT
jgi:hypothetical protein